MFNSLDEAIIVLDDGKEVFKNEKFENLMELVLSKSPRSIDEMMKTKFIKDMKHLSDESSKEDIGQESKSYSLTDLLEIPRELVKQMTFTIKKKSEDQEAKYVKVKMTKIKKDKLKSGFKNMIQIVDVSEKVLYKEVKDE